MMWTFTAENAVCVDPALQDSEQNRIRGVDVGDGKESAIERQTDANGLDQLHTDAARTGDDAAAVSASDRQVRGLD